MQLSPRYGSDPVVRIDEFETDPIALMNQQRERLARELAALDAEEWHADSRCNGWSVQDVVTHLVSTNQFWTVSISSGLDERPTTFLASFDPVASPAEIVTSAGRPPVEETLAAFVESNSSLAGVAQLVGDRTWTATAEAPPGHVSIGCVVLHALWDSLIHERDILLPLGRTPHDDPDEVAAALTYAAALGPAFLIGTGATGKLEIALRSTDPEVQLSIELGASVRVHRGQPSGDAAVIEGDATEMLEAFSRRAPLMSSVNEADRWLFEGLATAFDQA